MSDQNSTRLNKYISASGLCSRREADKHIERGNVFINGRRAGIGDRVRKGDRVQVNGNPIEPKKEEDGIFLAFNKPVGITSTTEINDRNNIVEYVNHPERIFPIGRLDKDSQGLIFLTNNGDIVNKILRAGNQHEKEYVVTVNKPVTDEFISGMANGVPILGVTTKKCPVTKEGQFVFKITLIQGMNRQIRRMCEYFGYEVTRLERIRIMNVSLKGLPVGDWRELTRQELEGIFKLVKNSTSTEEGSLKTEKKPLRLFGKTQSRQAQDDKRKTPSKKGSTPKPFWKTKNNGSGKKSGSRRSSGSSSHSNFGKKKSKSKIRGRGKKK